MYQNDPSTCPARIANRTRASNSEFRLAKSNQSGRDERMLVVVSGDSDDPTNGDRKWHSAEQSSQSKTTALAFVVLNKEANITGASAKESGSSTTCCWPFCWRENKTHPLSGFICLPARFAAGEIQRWPLLRPTCGPARANCRKQAAGNKIGRLQKLPWEELRPPFGFEASAGIVGRRAPSWASRNCMKAARCNGQRREELGEPPSKSAHGGEQFLSTIRLKISVGLVRTCCCVWHTSWRVVVYETVSAAASRCYSMKLLRLTPPFSAQQEGRQLDTGAGEGTEGHESECENARSCQCFILFPCLVG